MDDEIKLFNTYMERITVGGKTNECFVIPVWKLKRKVRLKYDELPHDEPPYYFCIASSKKDLIRDPLSLLQEILSSPGKEYRHPTKELCFCLAATSLNGSEIDVEIDQEQLEFLKNISYEELREVFGNRSKTQLWELSSIV